MRKILVVVVLVLVGVLCGWVTFHRSAGRASFTIETQKIHDDARRAIDEGKHAVDEGRRMLQKEGDSPADSPAR